MELQAKSLIHSVLNYYIGKVGSLGIHCKTLILVFTWLLQFNFFLNLFQLSLHWLDILLAFLQFFPVENKYWWSSSLLAAGRAELRRTQLTRSSRRWKAYWRRCWLPPYDPMLQSTGAWKGWPSIYLDPQPTLSTFQVGENRSTGENPRLSAECCLTLLTWTLRVRTEIWAHELRGEKRLPWRLRYLEPYVLNNGNILVQRMFQTKLILTTW